MRMAQCRIASSGAFTRARAGFPPESGARRLDDPDDVHLIVFFFQGPRRVYSAAVIGTIASIAPTLGPVIGGWITDTLNWHWLFYVNLLPGIAITVLVPTLVRI